MLHLTLWKYHLHETSSKEPLLLHHTPAISYEYMQNQGSNFAQSPVVQTGYLHSPADALLYQLDGLMDQDITPTDFGAPPSESQTYDSHHGELTLPDHTKSTNGIGNSASRKKAAKPARMEDILLPKAWKPFELQTRQLYLAEQKSMTELCEIMNKKLPFDAT